MTLLLPMVHNDGKMVLVLLTAWATSSVGKSQVFILCLTEHV